MTQRQEVHPIRDVVIDVLVSIIIPLACTPFLEPFQQLVVGIASYLVFSVSRIALRVGEITARRRRETDLLAAVDDLDRKLEELRRSYNHVLHLLPANENYPARLINNQIAEFCHGVFQAAANKVVVSKENAFESTKLLCDVVSNIPRPRLRLVYTLDNSGYFDSAWNKLYYRLQVEMAVQHGSIIERLFVVDTDVDITKPDIQRVFDFHARGPNFFCKVIQISEWRRIVDGLGLKGSLDFGIWGPHIVYTANSVNSERIEGEYTFDEDRVLKYSRIFGIGWEGAPMGPEPTAKAPMTLWELFEGQPPPPSSMVAEEALWVKKRRSNGKA